MNDSTSSSVTPTKTLDQLLADIKAYQPPSIARSQGSGAPVFGQTAPTVTPTAASVAPINPAGTAGLADTVPQGWTPSPVQSSAPVAQPTPISASSTAPVAPRPASEADKSESLESQNIFELLGVNQGSDADKEAFLDELQQVIWEDFLVNDTPLLLTRAELNQLQALKAQESDPAKQQEVVVTFLEKLVPDLEDIMLEKALELKREMVKERIAGLQDFLASQPAKLAELEKIEALMTQNKWGILTQALNQLSV